MTVSTVWRAVCSLVLEPAALDAILAAVSVTLTAFMVWTEEKPAWMNDRTMARAKAATSANSTVA